ncbi:MAG: M23 family metallopeptidase [Steroidobacteraceae bacterium]
MKKFLLFVVLLALAAGATWYCAGRGTAPVIDIQSPTTAIGAAGRLELAIDTPNGQLNRLTVSIEQQGVVMPVYVFPGEGAVQPSQAGPNRVTLVGTIGKQQAPQLVAGKATVIVSAERPVLFGYQHIRTTVRRDVEVRFEPPTVAALSTFQFINLGGSEMVVYRVSPADVDSGVRVGEYEYRGYPASGAGIPNADPGLRVAFFALLWDQDPAAPMALYARDAVGNEAHAPFDYRVFPKVYKHSRIELDDRYLARVVPPILQNSPELKVDNPSDLLGSFLRINNDLRRMNGEQIAALAQKSAPQILWQGAFKQLVNTAVEGSFADQRTYVYKGQEVDHQTHLGFDLASIAMTPVVAANRGRVLHAGWLGIYGNCVIVDHGMGLQSLYAHLSSIQVKVGDEVQEGQQLGRSGATGLAGGDHLHFTMLVGGHAVTPVDWWSAQWVQDRILRKLGDAGAPASVTQIKAVSGPQAQTRTRAPGRNQGSSKSSSKSSSKGKSRRK